MSRGPHAYLTPEERSLRAAAGLLYHAALRDGRLVPEPCAECGATPTDGHHEWGYEQPFRVRWLCRSHHGYAHREEQRRRFDVAYALALAVRPLAP